jgi:hypothetical protein
MAKWVQHQEAINLCMAHLPWCAELPPQDETDRDEPDSEDEDDEDTKSNSLNDQVTTKTPNVTSDHDGLAYLYHVAKVPAFTNTPLLCLELEYGASEFLSTLKAFIQQNITSHTLIPNEYDRFNIYNAVHAMHSSQPHISDHKCQKTIHTTPEHGNGPQPLRSGHHLLTLTLH